MNLYKEAKDNLKKEPIEMMLELLDMANRDIKDANLSDRELSIINSNNIDMIKHLIKLFAEQQIVLVKRTNRNNLYLLLLTVVMTIIAIIQIFPVIKDLLCKYC